MVFLNTLCEQVFMNIFRYSRRIICGPQLSLSHAQARLKMPLGTVQSLDACFEKLQLAQEQLLLQFRADLFEGLTNPGNATNPVIGSSKDTLMQPSEDALRTSSAHHSEKSKDSVFQIPTVLQDRFRAPVSRMSSTVSSTSIDCLLGGCRGWRNI